MGRLFDVHCAILRPRYLASERSAKRQVPLNNSEFRVISKIAAVDIICMEGCMV